MHACKCIEISKDFGSIRVMLGTLTALSRSRHPDPASCGGWDVRSIRGLLLLLRSFLVSPPVAICIFHLSIAVAGATVVIGIEFFPNLRFRFGLEVFVNALVVLVGTTAIRDSSIITRCQIIVLECGCQNCPRLLDALA